MGPAVGLSYDRKDDLIEIALRGLDHLIHSPRKQSIDYAVGHLAAALEIVDADEIRQIVRFREPLALPASASEA